VTGWFGADGFIPHGYCLSWDSDLMMAMVLSNAMIALAYLCITFVLVRKALEPVVVVPRWLYWSYAAFIFCCGFSHIVDDVTLWYPVYRLQAAILAATALISVFAALMPLSFLLTREAARWRK